MPSSIFARIRERGVLRVAMSYAVAAWLVLQISDVALQPWDVPNWIRRAPLVVALFGFPVALVLAWFLEIGDGGVRRDTAGEGVARPVAHGVRRYADIVVISILTAIVGFFVMRDAGWLGASLRPGATVESASLAVLPFASVGPVPEEYLGEGLSDELRTQFSRMQSLSVTGRASSMAFVGKALDEVTIAAKLAVAVLLEGTVGREAGRLNVSVQLVDGRNGKVLWAERYDRPDKDLLAVQSEIANAVVAAVLPHFAASGKKPPPPPTENAVAYDLYLLGRQHLRMADSAESAGDSVGQAAAMPLAAAAVEAFRSAIAADPGFAQAHASLARALMFQDDESDKRALAEYYDRVVMPEVERALELDPANSYAYFVKGFTLRATQRPGGSAAYRRAHELDPGNDAALVGLAAAAGTAGHFDERYRLMLLARDRDPMTWQYHMHAMVSAALLGRRDLARAAVERMQRQFPDDLTAGAVACRSRWFTGEQDEALACATRMLVENPGERRIVGWENVLAGDAWEAMGEVAQALRHYDRAVAAGDEDAEIQVTRLRRDAPSLRRRAHEALERELSIDDWTIADLLLRGGLPDEALTIYRRCGMANLASIDSNQLPDAMTGLAQMILLLRMHGEVEQARELLPPLLEYSSVSLEHGARWAGLRLLRAQALVLAGLNDEALEQIALAIDGPGAPFTADWLAGDPVLHQLGNDSRFLSLVDRLRTRQAETRARLPTTFRKHGLAWPPT